MAVPKRKMSRSNTRNRRSQWKAKLTELTTVRVQGREISVPRRRGPTRRASSSSEAAGGGVKPFIHAGVAQW